MENKSNPELGDEMHEVSKSFETDLVSQAKKKGIKIYKAKLFIHFQEFYGVK